MFRLKNIQGAQYSPLYFLSALGAGGISVSFFMYLMFMTPHKATPIPTWETLQAVFNGNELMLKILAIVALTGIEGVEKPESDHPIQIGQSFF